MEHHEVAIGVAAETLHWPSHQRFRRDAGICNGRVHSGDDRSNVVESAVTYPVCGRLKCETSAASREHEIVEDRDAVPASDARQRACEAPAPTNCSETEIPGTDAPIGSSARTSTAGVITLPTRRYSAAR